MFTLSSLLLLYVGLVGVHAAVYKDDQEKTANDGPDTCHISISEIRGLNEVLVFGGLQLVGGKILAGADSAVMVVSCVEEIKEPPQRGVSEEASQSSDSGAAGKERCGYDTN